MNKQFKQFQIYKIELGENIGSEEKGYRPVIIVSNNIGNRFSPTVLIAPLETLRPKNKKALPTHVIIQPTKENGLTEISEIQLEQTRCVDKQRFKDSKCIGNLNYKDINKFQKSILINYGVKNINSEEEVECSNYFPVKSISSKSDTIICKSTYYLKELENNIELLKNLVGEFTKEKSELYKELNDLEFQIFDLEHALEFRKELKLSATKLMQISLKISDIRDKRRNIKNEIYKMEKIVPKMDSIGSKLNNMLSLDSTKQLILEAEKSHQKPIYNPRTNICVELGIDFNKRNNR